jgi:hypothetical protein
MMLLIPFAATRHDGEGIVEFLQPQFTRIVLG